MGIIGLLIIGLVAGAIARFLVPGPDPIGIVGTLVLGVVGSLVGGTLYNLIFQGDLEFTTASWIGSIIGAVIALLIYRAVSGRGSRRRR
jgi:uncharacterized membrane protein YeaQ/YmgE (transglycosylase-associated protein family)